MRTALISLTIPVLTVISFAQTRASKTLDIYVIDVEGGNATLFVSPSGESLLIDTGNAGAAAVRDAGRIMDAVKDAGAHADRSPDHRRTGTAIISAAWRSWLPRSRSGSSSTTARTSSPAKPRTTFLQKTYPQLYAKAKHTVAKPGDKIAMAGLDVRVVTSAGETIKTPLPGAGKPNPYCASFKPGDNNAEDPQSVGSHVTFGKFRTVHLGRSDEEQGIRADVPDQSHRHGGCAVGSASRAGQLEFGGAGARASSSGRHHEQRHAQRRRAGGDEDAAFVARASKISGRFTFRC